MQSDTLAVHAFLRRAEVRLRRLAVIEGTAAGLAIALVPAALLFLLSANPLRAAAALAALGALAGGVSALRRRRPVAARIEARVPLRNVLITAAELISVPDRTPAYVGAVVLRDAAEKIAALQPRAVFPARRAWTRLLLAGAVWAAALGVMTARPSGARAPIQSIARASDAIEQIAVTIEPPAYARQPSETVRDPVRIRALSGSRLIVRVRTAAPGVVLEQAAGKRELRRDASGDFTAGLRAESDGFIALQPVGAAGTTGLRRLIGVSVQADQLPRVRLTTPGRDLFLPDAMRSIDVVVEAADDRALAALRLRYTRVSGSGEQFSFSEGEIPLAVRRASDQSWQGRGTLRLPALALNAGDLVVYRGVASDFAPGARTVESDAHFVEISGPGSLALEGMSADDEEDKYALSQQMVILKTERLIARAARMAADSVAEEARRLAAEQRSVRAEFVFMMGGELAEEVLQQSDLAELNEEAHAQADDELLEGRLANQGRRALLLAIRSMSRASSALEGSQLARALAEERAALEQLQRAFARTRYILRALTQRERLDLSRRLTGTLAGALGSALPADTSQPDPRVVRLRGLLADIAALADARGAQASAAAQSAALAQRVLEADPSAPASHSVAGLLSEAARLFAAGSGGEARSRLDRAAGEVTALLRAELGTAPSGTRSLTRARLEGALNEALRRSERR